MGWDRRGDTDGMGVGLRRGAGDLCLIVDGADIVAPTDLHPRANQGIGHALMVLGGRLWLRDLHGVCEAGCLSALTLAPGSRSDLLRAAQRTCCEFSRVVRTRAELRQRLP